MIVPNLVSTIIPVYNRPQMLREAVQSVLGQTYRPIEIIIVDDGSTDETPRVGEELAERRAGEVLFIRKENSGPGPTRESGRQIARGEFIQYLDSDDLLHPQKFEVQVAALRERPECGVAYGRTRLVDFYGQVLSDPFKWTGRRYSELFPQLLCDRWWCTHTPLYRRSVCDAVGCWSNLRYSQDWEYDGRVGARRVPLAYCDMTVSDHRQHQGCRQTGHGRWLTAPERVRFFSLMLRHARQAGVQPEAPEMQHFARWAFFQARQCGAMGDANAARACYELASLAAGRVSPGMRAYRWLTQGIGWRAAGLLAHGLDRMWRRKPGPATMKRSWET